MKRNSLMAATEAACLILSVDETIKNARSREPGADMMGQAGAAMMGKGPGAGRSRTFKGRGGK